MQRDDIRDSGEAPACEHRSPLFELNVWNREANQALRGQLQPLTMPECPAGKQWDGRSRPAHVRHLPSSATLAPVFPSLNLTNPSLERFPKGRRKGRSQSCTQRDSRARFGARAMGRNAHLGGRDHRLVARIVTQRIEVRIGLWRGSGSQWPAVSNTGPSSSSAASGSFKIGRQGARKIVARVHVLRVNQQGTA
jgi:hypothetical protein